MKILFTRFPLESSYGGAEVQTISLMKGLRDHGHAVAFTGSCPTLLRLCREENFPVVELDIGPPPVSKWTVLSFLWRKQKMQQQLETLLEQFQSLDAICMLSLSEKILLTEAAVKRGTKVLWIEHDRIGPWLTKNPWLKNLKQLSSKVTTVGVSKLSRDLYIGLGWDSARTIAIPNGVPLPPTPLPRRGRGVRESAGGEGIIHLGCVARLTKDKGVDLLIEAIADVPEVSLTIIGSGREEGFLRRMIGDIAAREHVAEPRIQLIASLPDLQTFYASIDALVLPSREHDPFGLVAAEAMACGVPVIVTDACGIAGHLEDGVDALIVESNSSSALQKSIKKLLEPTVRLALAEKGLHKAKETFSREAMIQRYEEVIS